MKLKYLGLPGRDGSYPSVKIDKDFVPIVDGHIDVPDEDAVGLIATKNFAAVDQVDPPAAPPKAPADLTPGGNEFFKPEDLAYPGSNDTTTIAEVDAEIKAANAGIPAGELDPAADNQAPNPVVNTDPNKAPETAPEPQPAQPAQAKAEAPVVEDKAALLERAKKLGIPANASWGIPSLTKAIAKAEAK